MITVRDWKPSDLGCDHRYEEEMVDDMEGITLCVRGRPVACGGFVSRDWGKEMWIEAPKSMTTPERLAVARIAKRYVEAELMLGDTIHAHVWSDDRSAPRWMSFLGFQYYETIEREDDAVDHYRLEP